MPVVYGRTRRADRWWRVLPARGDLDWLKATVLAATSGGAGLTGRPRFVLGGTWSTQLVGVACEASALSRTMNSDGRRALYCFVGWATDRPDVGDPPPALRDLERGFPQWAGAVYERWMALDWDLHESQLVDAHFSEPELPPWAPRPLTGSPRRDLPADSAAAWPLDESDVPWERVRQSARPETVVVGWEHLSDARLEPGMLVSARDVSSPQLIAVSGRAGLADVAEPPSGRRSPQTGPPPAPTDDPWRLATRRQPSAPRHEPVGDEPPPVQPPERRRESGLRAALGRLARGVMGPDEYERGEGPAEEPPPPSSRSRSAPHSRGDDSGSRSARAVDEGPFAPLPPETVAELDVRPPPAAKLPSVEPAVNEPQRPPAEPAASGELTAAAAKPPAANPAAAERTEPDANPAAADPRAPERTEPDGNPPATDPPPAHPTVGQPPPADPTAAEIPPAEPAARRPPAGGI